MSAVIGGGGTALFANDGRSFFRPQQTILSNPSTITYSDPNSPTTRGYRDANAPWTKNPGDHTPECLANGGVFNKAFDAVGDSPPMLRVKWAPNCSIPFHYHPTGALYFILYGAVCGVVENVFRLLFSSRSSGWTCRTYT